MIFIIISRNILRHILINQVAYQNEYQSLPVCGGEGLQQVLLIAPAGELTEQARAFAQKQGVKRMKVAELARLVCV
jgi:hypothetical protein